MSTVVRPPAFNTIYFDTNILRAHRWPDPLPELANVLVLSRRWKIATCFPEPVLEELECQWRRNVEEQISALGGTRGSLVKACAPVQCNVSVDHPPPTELLARFRELNAKAIADFGIDRVEFTGRSISEVFGYSARYLAPFTPKGEGKGFKDMVILLSILDHLRLHPDFTAILVTNDSDFKNVRYAPFERTFDSDRLRVVDLNTAWTELFEPYFDETRVQPYRRLVVAAGELAKARADDLRSFVAQHLTSEMIQPAVGETIREIQSVESVGILHVDVPFPDREPTDLEIDISINVVAKCSALVATDYQWLRAFFGQGALPPAPPVESDKKLTWMGIVRGTGVVASGELQDLTFRDLANRDS